MPTSFSYQDGNDWGWYVGIDNISVYSPYENDLSVSNLSSTISTCSSDSTDISVLLKNYGYANTDSSFTVTANINNGNQILTDSVLLSINSFDSVRYTFNEKVSLTSLNNVVSVSANYPNDGFLLNDSLTDSINLENSFSLPYTYDFENHSNSWKSSGINSSWQRGIPSGINIDTATSGTQIFATNLTGNANAFEESYLYSPCFDISNDSSAPVVSFNLIASAGYLGSGLFVQYLSNSDTTWNTIQPNINSINWGAPFFIGNSNGWIKRQIILTGLINKKTVKFRFKYSSLNVTSEGFGIDDFSINFQDSVDAKLRGVNILYQGDLECLYDFSKLRFDISNIGSKPIDTLILHYNSNNAPFYTDTIIRSIVGNTQIQFETNNKVRIDTGRNEIRAWISVKKDTTTSNDSIYFEKRFNTFDNNPSTIPYEENFDSFIPLSPFNGNYVGSFLNSWRNQGWAVTDQSTLSSNTGPNMDVTGGNFIFSDGAAGAIESMASSGCLAVNSDTILKLEFASHRYGDSIKVMYIEVFKEFEWEIVDSIVGPKQLSSSDPWDYNTYIFHLQKNSLSKIRFRVLQGIGFQTDLAIDDVKLTAFSYEDVKLLSILSPKDQCFYANNEPVSCSFTNVGIDTILPNNITLNFQLDTNSVVSQLYSDTLYPGDTVLFTFNQNLNLTSLSNNSNLSVYSSLNSDNISKNDTSKVALSNFFANSMYQTDFENFVSDCQEFNATNSFYYDLPLGWQDLSKTWLIQQSGFCPFTFSQGMTPTDSTGPIRPPSGISLIYMEASKPSTLPRVLKSNCMDFSSDTQGLLQFRYHKFGKGMGNLYIEIEDSLGSVITLDSIVGQTHFANTDPWLVKTVNLNNHVGQTFRILFRAELSQGIFSEIGDIAIDSLRVFNPLLVSNNEVEKLTKKFTLYPNPNNGNFNLNVANELVGKHYQIFDVKGDLVKQGKIHTTNSQIELSDAEKGVYFMRIEGQAKAERIVVL